MLYRYLTEITGRLAKADAGDATWLSLQSSCHDRIGDALRGDGHVAQAIESYRESFAVRTALVARKPGDIDAQRSLSILHEKIGDVLKAAGRPGEAAESHRAALAIREPAVKLAPSNALLHHDMAQSHAKIGECLIDLEDFSGALGSLAASRDIVRRLAAADPANARYQQDLWALNMNAGTLLDQRGDADGALASYREALAVAERRAAADPSDGQLHADIAIARDRIASLAARTGRSSSDRPLRQGGSGGRGWGSCSSDFRGSFAKPSLVAALHLLLEREHDEFRRMDHRQLNHDDHPAVEDILRRHGAAEAALDVERVRRRRAPSGRLPATRCVRKLPIIAVTAAQVGAALGANANLLSASSTDCLM